MFFYIHTIFNSSWSSTNTLQCDFNAVAQNGQTKHWIYDGPFVCFTSFAATIGSPTCLKGDSEAKGYLIGCHLQPHH